MGLELQGVFSIRENEIESSDIAFPADRKERLRRLVVEAVERNFV
jgi:hypothetical protein